jgi:protein-disulfide isomerase
MKNLPLLIGTLLGTLILVVGLAFVFSRPEPEKVADVSLVQGTMRLTKGPENAKVTLVEFSDFQCPTCAAYEPQVKALLEKYPNDIRFVYRHYPLTNIHPNAQRAAEAAEAAASFDKFWEFHDVLFAEQKTWSPMNSGDFEKKLEEYVEKLAIDKTEFQKKMNSKEVKDAVTADVSDGTRAEVDGTPTFYVNGKLIPALQQLQSAVESEIQAKQ